MERVKRTSGKHGKVNCPRQYNWNTVENDIEHHTINQAINIQSTYRHNIPQSNPLRCPLSPRGQNPLSMVYDYQGVSQIFVQQKSPSIGQWLGRNWRMETLQWDLGFFVNKTMFLLTILLIKFQSSLIIIVNTFDYIARKIQLYWYRSVAFRKLIWSTKSSQFN